MADTLTLNYHWVKPGDHVNASTWGAENNANWDGVDSVVYANTQGLTRVSATLNTVTLTKTATAGAVVAYNGVVGTNQLRWWAGIDSGAESLGTNTNSNYYINRYDDNGNFLGTPFEIVRATGAVTIAQSLTAGQIYAEGVQDLSGYTICQAPNATSNVSYALSNSAGATEGYLTWNYVNNAIVLYNANGGAALTLAATGAISASGNFSCGFATVAGLSSVGDATVSGNLTTSGNATINSGLVTNGGLNVHGTVNLLQEGTTNYAYTLNTNSGTYVAQFGCLGASSSNVGIFTTYNSNTSLQIAPTGDFLYSGGTGAAYKNGGGSWSAISDERIKTVTGEYQEGLEAVCNLRPVVYRYKGNDGGPGVPATVASGDLVGLVAQEAEAVMPGMVTRKEGYIDGEKVDDLRTLDPSSLVFALVNAVKELKAEIEALKAAR